MTIPRFYTSFEPNRGHRLYRDRCSILISALSCGVALSDQEILGYAQALEVLVDSISGRPAAPDGHTQVVRPSHLIGANDHTFFKFVSEKTWTNYLSRGSFQFGSAAFYRDAENQDIRDVQEGEGQIFFRSGEDQVSAHVTSGFNCALFCGTAVSTRSDVHMQTTFGDRCIKISPLPDFMDALQRRLKARRVLVRDVVYTNRKAFVVNDSRTSALRSLLKEMDRLNPALLNRRYFELLYQVALFPSLLVKPAKYSRERERRIIIELEKDLTTPTIKLNAPELVKFLSVVDDADLLPQEAAHSA